MREYGDTIAMKSTTEILCEGMNCLIETMGIVEAEQFIAAVRREQLDYTEWQRSHFDSLAPGAFQEQAVAYAQAHPYTGTAQRL